MLNKVLIMIALVGGTTVANGEPQKHKLPIGLQLRIVMLNTLAYVQTEMIEAFTKANSPALHDQVTARVVSTIREKSAQSEADFAAAASISVETLQQVEQDGTGLDREALERIWGMGLLSIEELAQLRVNVVVTSLSDEEKALIGSRASTLVKNMLTVLRYTQASIRKDDSMELPAAADILTKMRDDHSVLLQLAAEHYPQIKEFISIENFSDELITSIATANATTDKLRHHTAFMFFQDQIISWQQEQQAAKPAAE